MCMCEEGDFYYLYIWIKLKFIIMQKNLSNLLDSSFKHVLHSYGIFEVSTCKYEIDNYLFYSIFYLLNNHLSYSRIKSKLSFLFDLHQDVASNEY
jgi:hypothetical protein